MTNHLLLEYPMNIVVYVTAGVLALFFLIGFIRRFSRMSWTGLQAFIVFAFTLLVPVLAKEESTGAFVWAAVILVGGSILVTFLSVGLKGLLRRGKKAGLPLRLLDRFFGGLTAIINFAVPLVAILGLALVSMNAFGVTELLQGEDVAEVLNGIIESELVSKFVLPYALDILLAYFFIACIGGGYKLGLARGLWAILAVALTIGTALVSLLLVLKVGFIQNIAAAIANCFSTLNPVVAALIGFGITFAICCIVILAVVIVLHVLINMLVKRIARVRPLRFIDGAIMTVIFSAIALVAVMGFNFGIHMLATIELPSELSEVIPSEAVDQIRGIVATLSEVFTSSPVAKIFYSCNPFTLASGGGV